MTSHNLKILAIDTVTEVCSVALNLHGAVTQRLEIAAGHSRLVLGMAQTLLRQCGLTLDQLDALAVDIGPGSFTGTRIGIGVAQGLAFGAGLKVIPVRSLEALAHAQPNETVLPAIDARMGQIYHGLYRTPDGVLQTIGEPALAEPAQLARPQQGGIVGVGSAWDRYAPMLLEATGGAVSKWLAGRHPEARAVSQVAAARGLIEAVSPLDLIACYVREEVAERPSTPPDAG